ncbi:hypothetical protein BRW65_26425 [Mycobacterium paraffinicum]|uniref:Uncharacterized protein n=1 Tax=Mycobacterium paraffinicum TaxID=53378 RepID=A0A1Q4HIK0_9MYCO|nr:hypothetical protein [Mycobacterium paraffinicum]OJZ67323.1 hypothetical protein BRW65_26425 [Mycobacterium paraffinicum]
MTVEGALGDRRWRSAIAIVAALCVFCAVTAGWASRGTAVAGVGPPHLAVAQGAAHPGVDPARVHTSDMGLGAQHFSSGSAPTHHSTTKNAWMTRDRPPTWARSSPPSLDSPLPTSFAAAAFRLPRPPSRAPGAVPLHRHLLTQLCVARC